MKIRFPCDCVYEYGWLKEIIDDESNTVWADNPQEDRCVAITIEEAKEILRFMEGKCPICG